MNRPSPDIVALPPAVSYELAAGGRGSILLERRCQRDGPPLWAILESGSSCLVAPASWEFERMPSSRTEEYLARARRPLPDALALWDLHLLCVAAGGTSGAIYPGMRVGESRVFDPRGALSAPPHSPTGSWIPPSTTAPVAEIVGEDRDWEVRHAPANLDGALRVALTQAWSTQGDGMAVASGDAFEPSFERAVREFAPGVADRIVPAVLSDLRAATREGRLRMGWFDLVSEGDRVVARGSVS